MKRAFLLLVLTISPLFAVNLDRGLYLEDHKWQSGDTFLSFLQENTLPLKLYYHLDNDDKKLMMDIRVGNLYNILRDENGTIEQVLLPIDDELELHIVKDINNTYRAKVIPIIYQTKKRTLFMKFDSIPSKDILKKTGNFELALEVESIFRNVIDFRKIRKGDRLVLFYREKRRLGSFFGEQKIYAAMIEVAGKKYYQFLAKDGKYYDEKGKGVAKSSFIVPCKYRRISSKFTKKRWHPVLRRYRAHHGIDYATPVGTAIKATFDGKVIFAGRRGGYGKCVIIKHPYGYKSVYGHLSRIKTAVGRRVKKGQVIALSGNTGLSTGPHLHFGISLNGRWVNPATKIVIKGGLSGKKRKEFIKSSKIYIQKIKNVLQSNQTSQQAKSLEVLEEE